MKYDVRTDFNSVLEGDVVVASIPAGLVVDVGTALVVGDGEGTACKGHVIDLLPDQMVAIALDGSSFEYDDDPEYATAHR